MVREYTHQDKVWADKVKAVQKEADGYNHCVLCQATQNLQADHIKSYKDHPELRHDVNNGTVLCGRCNKKKGAGPAVIRVSYINTRYLDTSVLKF